MSILYSPIIHGKKKREKDRVVSSGIVDHRNLEWKMYIMEQKGTEFNYANSATMGIKFTKYEKEQLAVQFTMRGYRWR
jgi:hypothetical protein